MPYGHILSAIAYAAAGMLLGVIVCFAVVETWAERGRRELF